VLAGRLPERRTRSLADHRRELRRQPPSDRPPDRGAEQCRWRGEQPRPASPRQRQRAARDQEQEGGGERGRGRAIAAPEQQRAPRLLGDRERRQVGVRVAPQEVEDPRAARVAAGRERRPRHRRLRRRGRSQAGVAATRGEFREARQLSRGDHALRELGVDAVEAEHDQAAYRGSRRVCGHREKNGSDDWQGAKESTHHRTIVLAGAVSRNASRASA
jgi:hypothetical protein